MPVALLSNIQLISRFRSGPVRIQTISEPHQSPCGSGPSGCLDQWRKRTLILLKRTKSGRSSYFAGAAKSTVGASVPWNNYRTLLQGRKERTRGNPA
ncbi:hypothetical protein ILYODFUR_008470 [Ilyodon furcidens]|uniref:Uncharacterized protein n=1 Tax=Ilyodon furcidens TaxID=33524 RepID=A0ABV0SV91_9TELE